MGALAAGAVGFFGFGAGGAFGCGAVAGGDVAQLVVVFDLAGFCLGAFVGVGVAGFGAVLADRGGEDVDAVAGVADGDPAAGAIVFPLCVDVLTVEEWLGTIAPR
ncbi:hypothetical protein [Actinacidiphila epipremni]|uniref:Uncharacterized protein n=1 Tax=Actinacidiphila epipremni TaxID=2053013 RepID=A0ABX0ZW95_9ACTN|nr:hypothetical protein [Actinacidiphila epipremni]NJP47207.1 hypothetical protein [Actinacidiphila epipremni]